MSDQHAYYCPYCTILVGATSLAQLCVFVNDHNYAKHPGDNAAWSPAGLSCSLHYTGPDADVGGLLFADGHVVRIADGRLVPPDPTLGAGQSMTISRLTKWGGEWGTAEKPPVITTEDLTMLREGLVRW